MARISVQSYLPWCLVWMSCFLSRAVEAQEPRTLVVSKQPVTSMSPSEDVTFGGVPHRIGGLPVRPQVQLRHFQAPGWDSQPHQYLVLDKQAGKGWAHKSKPANPPVIERRPVEPYAYGWFGAKMNRHPQRSFGYQHAYTQWAFE